MEPDHPMAIAVASLASVPWESGRISSSRTAREVMDFMRELAAVAYYFARGWI
jgi:hypothetical protein